MNEFFQPFFFVASWFFGIFGGLFAGVAALCLVVGIVIATIFAVVFAFITAMDLWSSFTYKRAVRRARKQLHAIRE